MTDPQAPRGTQSPDELASPAESEHRRPSPTSRARRAAASGVATRRPAPHPASPATESPIAVGADDRTEHELATAVAPVSVTRPAGSTRSPLRLAAWLLAAAVLLGLAIAWLLTAPSTSSSKKDREAALNAAKEYSALVQTYNYQHLDADRDRALRHLTGRFADDYKKAMNDVVAVEAPKVKAVVEGQVESAGLEAVSGSGKQVTVIVFGQQKVTNSALTQPRTDIVRLRVVLDRVGSEWKIAKVDQI